MKRIKINDPYRSTSSYPEDVARIVKSFAANDYEITDEEAAELWRMYSDCEYCAGWIIMSVYSDEDVFKVLKPYWREA